MFGLERIAEGFDRIHADVQRDVDRFFLEDSARKMGEQFGPDSFMTWQAAISSGITWSLITFTLGSGKSLVDVLRLGEGTKTGTAKGVAQDGLRLLNLAPAVGAAARGLGMTGRVAVTASAARVVGQQGAMSCGPTALAAASRLSGQRAALTLDEVGTALGRGHPNSPSFNGMWFHEFKSTMDAVSVTHKEINMAGQGIDAVEAAAAQGKGPVVFGIQYWTKANNIIQPASRIVPNAQTGRQMQQFMNAGTNYAEAGDHWMVAFRSASGRVLVADQQGMRSIADLTKAGNFTVTSRALLVPDGALMRVVGAAESLASATSTSGSNARWLASSFMINAVVVNAPTTAALDNRVRDAMGRPPREWPGVPVNGSSGSASRGRDLPGPRVDQVSGQTPGSNAPSTIPLPNILSPTLIQDSLLVLARLPVNGDTREFATLEFETGLPAMRVRDGLLRLVSSGLIVVTHWGTVGGRSTPVMAKRAMRR
ncbi:hypothetical protein RNZ50_13335 [Paracoccaceae bacterium Fryx2]|nr:hypothetical protein [Paracoccaceae bacterium Fryx2]